MKDRGEQRRCPSTHILPSSVINNQLRAIRTLSRKRKIIDGWSLSSLLHLVNFSRLRGSREVGNWHRSSSSNSDPGQAYTLEPSETVFLYSLTTFSIGDSDFEHHPTDILFRNSKKISVAGDPALHQGRRQRAGMTGDVTPSKQRLSCHVRHMAPTDPNAALRTTATACPSATALYTEIHGWM